MKKLLKIGLIITLSVVLVGLLFLLIRDSIKHDIIFNLNGEKDIILSLNSEYVEEGAKAIIDGEDRTDKIKIDYSDMNTDVIGLHRVRYYFKVNKKEYSIYRNILIIDDIKPEIILNGNSVVNILLGSKYSDSGAKAHDNYDGDITSKIEIESNIDTNKVGEYIITYKVKDSSGNETKTTRKVIVKKPIAIVYENKQENKEVIKKVEVTKYSNTVTENKFTDKGFNFKVYLENENKDVILKLQGDNTYTFNLENKSNNTYYGNIDLTNIPIGKYNLLIISNEKELNLLNKMSFISKIKRSKVLDKLVTFNYNNDEVSITIEPFNYLYDILIDPGHGGEDTGASNKYIYEKDMNLTVSLYEKCRYEKHGLKVYMTRYSDTYGAGIGDSSLSKLHRRAYEVGYYGVVSKIVYSNHHNSSSNNSLMGYEILLPGKITNLNTELSIVSKFNTMYNLSESHKRFYAKDYDTEVMYSKLNKEVYTFKDNYAINRIPYEVFNTKAIIYEGIYMSNDKDYNWYWEESNWIKISEIKIEEYVKSLGFSYNSDNTSCI